MTSVFIADDHPVLRQGLVGLLGMEDDLTVVGEAEDGQTAITEALRLRPDVIIMDLRMPLATGPEAIEAILARADESGWNPRILVLTTYEDDDSITAAIEAGATGYLLKSASPDEITAAVRATGEGRAVLAPSVATALVRQVKTHTPQRALSPREIEVVSLMAEGLSNAEIAVRLVVEPSTVKTHVEHIFGKLGVNRRTQAIGKAREAGLL